MKTFLTTLSLTILLAISCSANQKKVLVIESYHAEYPWDISYKQGLEKGLEGEYDIEYFEMDTKRLPPAEHQARSDLAWQKYLEAKPDLVVLGDDNAVKYLHTRFEETDTPIVYLGINSNPRAYNIIAKKNFTGVLERPLLKRSIAYLKMIKPLKRVLILFDSGTTANIIAQESFKGKESEVFGGISVDIKLIGDFSLWKKTVQEIDPAIYDVLIIGLYHTIKDENNEHIDAEKIIRWTSANTPIPPFAFWDFSVGPDMAAGGYVLFGQEQGEAAAKLIKRILSGTPPGTIPPQTGEKGRFLFSQTQLEKWKIELPAYFTARAEIVD